MKYYLTNDNFNNMADDFGSLFSDLFGGYYNNGFDRVPSVDVHEMEKAYTILADLPGFEEKDVNLNVKNHVLNLKSLKKQEEKKGEKEDKLIVNEREELEFDRSFKLPEDVDEGKIVATFKNGQLEITLPKKEAEEPKAIEIKIE